MWVILIEIHVITHKWSFDSFVDILQHKSKLILGWLFLTIVSIFTPNAFLMELLKKITSASLKMTQNLHDRFRSDQISLSVVSNSLWPHESQHARPPCPSPTPGVHSDSRPLSQWCHPTISSSAVPFSSCPQSLPASVSFPVSQLFTWGGQSTGVTALASFLPKNTQDWFPYNGLVGSPCHPKDSQESSLTPQFKSINSSALSFLHSPTLTSIHDHRKNHSLN